MVSGLVLLLPCSPFLFFLGFSAPLAPSGGSSSTPHPGFTHSSLQTCASASSASCPSRCPLPPSQSAKSGSRGKDGGRGALPSPPCNSCRPLSSPESHRLSVPSPRRVPVPAGEGTLARHLSLHPLASREVPGARRRARKKRKSKKRRGGNNSPTATHKQDHHHQKKRETLRNVEL